MRASGPPSSAARSSARSGGLPAAISAASMADRSGRLFCTRRCTFWLRLRWRTKGARKPMTGATMRAGTPLAAQSRAPPRASTAARPTVAGTDQGGADCVQRQPAPVLLDRQQAAERRRAAQQERAEALQRRVDDIGAVGGQRAAGRAERRDFEPRDDGQDEQPATRRRPAGRRLGAGRRARRATGRRTPPGD